MISSSEASTATEAAADTGPIGRCSGMITPLVAITIARWIDVLQLAHVARPVVADEAVERVGRDAALAEVDSAYLARKCSTSSGMSRRRSRSGGRFSGDHVEPVVEVLAELPLAHHGLEVAVGGGQHAHVDADRLVAADALDRPLLQRAQRA